MNRVKNGTLLVYAPEKPPRKTKLIAVTTAAEKMARLLNLNIEIVKQPQRTSPIYVYYENGKDEPVPIYCDRGKLHDTKEVCGALRNMLFVLSFHPKNSVLRNWRHTLMTLS
jgi:hypothetical protein